MKNTLCAGLLLASWLSAQQVPTDEELAAAVARYQELGLPQAPANAPLVLLLPNRGSAPLQPAFRLATNADGKGVYLSGTCTETELRRVAAVEPLAKPLVADGLVVDEWLDDFDRDQDLAAGLQLWARGYQEVARVLVQRKAHGQRLLDRTAQLAAAHWLAQVHESEEPLERIEQRLRAAVALLPEDGAPVAAGTAFVWMQPWRQLLDQLASSVSKPVPGVDAETALVLAMVRSRRAGGLGRDRDGDAPFDAVVRRGFASVPALIGHLADDRLTRARTVGINNMRSYTRPLGEVASDALQEIAGDVVPCSGGIAPRIAVADAEAWWATASRQAEDEYMVASFLRGHTGSMRILAAKWPERLYLAIVEMVERTPERAGYDVIDAIADGSMRKAQKVELLERIAAATLDGRLHALRRLADVDEERFCARFLEVLASAPKEMPKEVWTSPHGSLGHLVVLTGKRDVWQAFVRTARALPIGLRMQYMAPFAYRYLADRQRAERLACLAAFLDDDEVYDVAASGQQGPHAAFTFSKLAMRDFAAHQLAMMFRYEAIGGPKSTATEWAELRERVRRSLQEAGVVPMSIVDGK
ncbi:MAG: hypothetical protein ACK501_08705 [Planctomycetota bacterium]|jgi:hypothetical protein